MENISCIIKVENNYGIMLKSSIDDRSVLHKIGTKAVEEFATDIDFYNSKMLNEIDETIREELVSMFKYSTPLHLDNPMVASSSEITDVTDTMKSLIPPPYIGKYKGFYEYYSITIKESH